MSTKVIYLIFISLSGWALGGALIGRTGATVGFLVGTLAAWKVTQNAIKD